MMFEDLYIGAAAEFYRQPKDIFNHDILSYLNMIDLVNSAGISFNNMATWLGISQLYTIIITLIYGSVSLLFFPSLIGYSVTWYTLVHECD